MAEFALTSEFHITEKVGLRALFPPTHAIAKQKSLPALGRHAKDFLAPSPFVHRHASGRRQNRREMPLLVKIIPDQTTGAPDSREERQRLDEGLEEAYRTSMY